MGISCIYKECFLQKAALRQQDRYILEILTIFDRLEYKNKTMLKKMKENSVKKSTRAY